MATTMKRQVFMEKEAWIRWLGVASAVITLLLGMTGSSMAEKSCDAKWQASPASGLFNVGTLCVPNANVCNKDSWGYPFGEVCKKSTGNKNCANCKCEEGQICQAWADGHSPTSKEVKFTATSTPAKGQCGQGDKFKDYVLCSYKMEIPRDTKFNCECKCGAAVIVPDPKALKSGLVVPGGSNNPYEGLQKPGATSAPNVGGKGSIYEGLEKPVR